MVKGLNKYRLCCKFCVAINFEGIYNNMEHFWSQICFQRMMTFDKATFFKFIFEQIYTKQPKSRPAYGFLKSQEKNPPTKNDVVLKSSFVQILAYLESFFLSFSMLALLYFKYFFFRPILVLKCDQGFVGYKASFRWLCLFYPIYFCHLRRTNKSFLFHLGRRK